MNKKQPKACYPALRKKSGPFLNVKHRDLPSSLSPVNIFPGVKIWVYDVTFLQLGRRSRTMPHMHTAPDIFYVNRGKMTLRVYGRRIGVEAGNMILVPSGVSHSVECRRPAEYYCINYIARIDKTRDNSKPGHFDLAELCRNRMGMSPRNFFRIFKRVAGCSPREYILRLKMEKARAMLNKKITTKIVAEKLGYEDIHSFYRAFHKATGHGVLAAFIRQGGKKHKGR